MLAALIGAHSLKPVSFQLECKDRSVTRPRNIDVSLSQVATALLQCADDLRRAGCPIPAEAVCRAATPVDQSPCSRLKLAELLLESSRFSEAIAVYDELLPHPDLVAEPRIRAVVFHNLAVALRKTGQLARANACQGHAQRAELEDSGGLTPESLMAVASEFQRQGQMDLAEQLLLRAVSADGSTRSRNGAMEDADDVALRGVAELSRGRLTEAIRLLGRACAEHRRCGDHRQTGVDLLNLAEAFRRLTRWRLSARCLRRAVQQLMDGGTGELCRIAQQRLEEAERMLGLIQHDPLRN